MLQFFDTLADVSGNALLGATVTVTNYPSGSLANIYSANGTASPIVGSLVTADITGQVSFYAPDGAYTLTYVYKGTTYKVRSPVQLLDPMGFVSAADSGGAANAYAVAGSQYPAQLYVGLKVEILAAHTNTGASTIQWQGGATQPFRQPGGSALIAGMVQANGIFRAEWDGTQWQLLGTQSQPFYALSPKEQAQGTVVTDSSKLWGSLLRYGADPTGVSDSHAALLAAANANSDVFDDYPGGGAYLFNSETVLTNYPVRIRGQKALVVNNNVVLNGTQFKLATAAGAGAAILRTTGFFASLDVLDIGFTFQTQTIGQIGLRFSLDFRYSRIRGCVFQGGGTGSRTTSIGIQCDGGGTFSGDVIVAENFFLGGLLRGCWIKGSSTTFKVTHNEFYGYGGVNSVQSFGAITAGAGYTDGIYNDVPLTGGSGTSAQAQITVLAGAVTQVILTAGGNDYTVANTLSASNANLGGAGAGFSIPVATVGNQYGSGLQFDGPVTEPATGFNYFEGWTAGIYSNGAARIKQMANDYAVCSAPFIWIKKAGGYANVLNESFGETLSGGSGTPVFSQTDADANIVVGAPGYFFPGGAVQSIRGFQEGGGAGTALRAFNMGYINDVAFNAGNFTGNGAMTWTVAGGNVTAFSYSVVGKTLTIFVNIAGSTVGGTPNTTLQIALPGGFQASKTIGGPIGIENNGVFTSVGFWQIITGTSLLQIFRDAAGATPWTASANTGVVGTFSLPIA